MLVIPGIYVGSRALHAYVGALVQLTHYGGLVKPSVCLTSWLPVLSVNVPYVRDDVVILILFV